MDRELYAERGRPSIDPVIFFKLQLIMFFEGIRSERKLIETASLNLAHRWYLGYALDEALPDHSSLTRIRQRLGIDIFQRFFEQVVDLCQEAGLVWGRELYFDATKVEANAGIPSLIPRFYYEATAHVAKLFADDAPGVAARDGRPLGLDVVTGALLSESGTLCVAFVSQPTGMKGNAHATTPVHHRPQQRSRGELRRVSRRT